MADQQLAPSSHNFWLETAAVSKAEYIKLKRFRKQVEKARLFCAARHVERLNLASQASLTVEGKACPILPAPSPEVVNEFTFMDQYRATVFCTSPSIYRVQISHITDDKPVTDGDDDLPFQAFRTSLSGIGSVLPMWAPCWTSASSYEIDGRRKVYYTFDNTNKMMFVDKVTKECLGEIAFTMDVNVAPSPRLQPHVQDLVNAVIDKGLDFDCRT
ncbi:hypothetical protein SISSUDRAFT_1129104 [Sistotremastrum suecicum HHB10207 ss-3]|uniref:Uncharacterized protein n=1 Tax=Sistotremastrum suecicum HHB10207 ss-3 TaxID=1314776 RepID=A0A166D3I7_9AGAM|nr:hypothetical protein SISSUDRAFT_1129104 [Sistotremastrum suecicum HHB10207 ss-3]